jgi:putative chitinase
MVNINQLGAIMPHAGNRIFEFFGPLNDAMDEFEINTPQRQAAFLAQVAHESGELRYVEEIASGAAYEGRLDLGNSEPGDGVRFKGRGLIQITGRSNYASCGSALGLDLLAQPELLTTPANAARSAGWFWRARGCSELADADNFRRITLRINGGLTHYDDGPGSRVAYWNVAKEQLFIGDQDGHVTV